MTAVPFWSQEWPRVPFGRLIESGAFGPRFPGADYAGDGNLATLRTTDLSDDGRISYATMPRASLDISRFADHLLQRDDLVISRSGTCGIAAVFLGYEVPVLPGAFLIRCRLSRDVEPQFYRYFFNSPAGRSHVLSIAHGAVQQNINLTNLRLLPVPQPPSFVQRAIVARIAAYDDLIENCERRIRILDDMARALYREWFVDFRYPGHENIPLVDSPLGPIPRGWATSTIGELAEPDGVQTGPFGSQLHQEEYSTHGVPVVMPKDLRGYRIDDTDIARVPEAVAERVARHRMMTGDIVYGRRGDIGRRAFVTEGQAGSICGTGCLRIRPASSAIDGWYMFHYLGGEEVVAMIAGRAHGATMPNLNTRLLSTVPITVPPRTLQNRFRDVTLPLAKARDVQVAVARTTRTSRDLLLPRLLTGEVGVGELA